MFALISPSAEYAKIKIVCKLTVSARILHCISHINVVRMNKGRKEYVCYFIAGEESVCG
jgi:hypothetical protein